MEEHLHGESGGLVARVAEEDNGVGVPVDALRDFEGDFSIGVLEVSGEWVVYCRGI